MDDAGPWPERPDDDVWNEAGRSLRPGDLVKATVVSHRRFGFFVTLDDYGVPGLVEITSYTPRVPRHADDGRLQPHFPDIGSTLEAEVLGLRERERRIALRYLEPPVA